MWYPAYLSIKTRSDVKFLASSCSGLDLELKLYNYFFFGSVLSGAITLQNTHRKGVI